MDTQWKEILTAEEAAEFLGFNPVTVRLKARSGEIPGRKIGKEWRFSRTALLEWLREGEDSERRGPVVIVRADPKGAGFVATVEGVPDIIGRGETEEEAYQDLRPELEAAFHAKKYRTEMPDKNTS